MSPRSPKGAEAPSEQSKSQDLPGDTPHEVDEAAKPDTDSAAGKSLVGDDAVAKTEAAKPSEDPADKPTDGPPLPNEPVPEQDDGWECQWDQHTQAWFFHNHITGKTQWDNPRVPEADGAATASNDEPQLPANEDPDSVTGYNPAIHGDYDPNAWYAQRYKQDEQPEARSAGATQSGAHGTVVAFNKFTGDFQIDDLGPGRHTDESKAKRQMSAFFDIDAAAAADDGRSLRAERANKRISKSELKAFREKRKAKKQERRLAWLRD